MRTRIRTLIIARSYAFMGGSCEPVLHRIPPLGHVKLLGVVLKGCFVPVLLHQVDPVRLLAIFEDVKAEAARLIVYRAPGIFHEGFHKLVFKPGFDVDGNNQSVHRFQ